MQQKPKGIAARRAHRQRMREHARDVVHYVWGQPWRPVYKYADNLTKCSCHMCNSGDPHDHRQFKRADAQLAFEMQRMKENYT